MSAQPRPKGRSRATSAGLLSPPSIRVGEASRLRLQQAKRHARVREQEREQVVTVDDRAPKVRTREDIGRDGLPQQGRDLAEEHAGVDAAALVAVDDHAYLAVDDHVQPAVLPTLTQHPVAFVELDDVDHLVERCERVRGHVGEERMPRQALGHECQSERRWTPESGRANWPSGTEWTDENSRKRLRSEGRSSMTAISGSG